ncbi:MAG: hypothetical protein Q8M83_03685 [bacterium]|nr:hypothetical protein [bacterium]
MSLIVVPKLWVEWCNCGLPFEGNTLLHGIVATKKERCPTPFFSQEAGFIILEEVLVRVARKIDPVEIKMTQAFIEHSALPKYFTEIDTLVFMGNMLEEHHAFGWSLPENN